MRLGAYAAKLIAGSRVYSLYKDTGRLNEDVKRIEMLKKEANQRFRLGKMELKDIVIERHRHRYEVNPRYIKMLENKGIIFSGKSPDGKLMEFFELRNHPFFAGTQAHPEYKSTFLNPSPLYVGFLTSLAQSP